MDAELLAKEADRLANDSVLLEALDRLKTEAYEALVQTDADKTTDILRLQQRVLVISDFASELEAMINSLPKQDEGPTPYA